MNFVKNSDICKHCVAGLSPPAVLNIRTSFCQQNVVSFQQKDGWFEQIINKITKLK